MQNKSFSPPEGFTESAVLFVINSLHEVRDAGRQKLATKMQHLSTLRELIVIYYYSEFHSVQTSHIGNKPNHAWCCCLYSRFTCTKISSKGSSCHKGTWAQNPQHNMVQSTTEIGFPKRGAFIDMLQTKTTSTKCCCCVCCCFC